MTTTAILTGNLTADPVDIGSGERQGVRFRMASSERYRDRRTGEWTNGKELWVNVCCWGRLADGVRESLHRGDPVIVIGRPETDEYIGTDGQRRSGTQVIASAVGHDLSWGDSRFRRSSRSGDRPAPEATASAHGGPTNDDPWMAADNGGEADSDELAGEPVGSGVGAAGAFRTPGGYSDD
jgi:single-strand DNA-binding protein